MRTAFADTLCELTEKDGRIWLLTGDLGYSVLEQFAHRFPERFVNIGVAEQNMTGVATGLALCGKVVFTYSIANFPTLRCLEQIRNDICYHNLNVKIVAVGGGFAYGAQGMTHHATEDLAIMRTLPNMTVIAPGDPVETHLAIQAIADLPGPCYIRLGKTREPVVYELPPDFRIGKAIIVRDGTDIALIATGAILYNAMRAAEKLSQQGIEARVLSMHTLKPLDEDAVLAAAREIGPIVTIEEHSAVGGLGSAVADILAQMGNNTPPFGKLSIGDSFLHIIGSQDYLCQARGLSVDDICSTAHDILAHSR